MAEINFKDLLKISDPVFGSLMLASRDGKIINGLDKMKKESQPVVGGNNLLEKNRRKRGRETSTQIYRFVERIQKDR